MGKVTRITTRQASVEIICVGDTVLLRPRPCHSGRSKGGGVKSTAFWSSIGFLKYL